MESELSPKDDSRGGWEKNKNKRGGSDQLWKQGNGQIRCSCSVSASCKAQIPKPGEARGPEKLPWVRNICYWQMQRDGHRTDPEIVCGCVSAGSWYIFAFTCIWDVLKKESLLRHRVQIIYSSVALNSHDPCCTCSILSLSKLAVSEKSKASQTLPNSSQILHNAVMQAEMYFKIVFFPTCCNIILPLVHYEWIVM